MRFKFHRLIFFKCIFLVLKKVYVTWHVTVIMWVSMIFWN